MVVVVVGVFVVVVESVAVVAAVGGVFVVALHVAAGEGWVDAVATAVAAVNAATRAGSIADGLAILMAAVGVLGTAAAAARAEAESEGVADVVPGTGADVGLGQEFGAAEETA